jgi:hypothetical protein
MNQAGPSEGIHLCPVLSGERQVTINTEARMEKGDWKLLAVVEITKRSMKR